MRKEQDPACKTLFLLLVVYYNLQESVILNGLHYKTIVYYLGIWLIVFQRFWNYVGRYSI